MRFSLDELDDFNIPLTGSQFIVEWLGSREGLGADSKFDQLSVLGSAAFTRSRNTLVAFGLYNTTRNGTAPIQSLFPLGGFGRLSGFTARELRGQNAAMGALVYYRRLNDSRALPIYAGMTVEMGNVWDSRSDISLGDTITAGSLFVAINTAIGPVYLAYGHAEGDHKAGYFFLGRPF